MNTVLILSDSLDIHSDVVEQKLNDLDVRVIRINTDRFAVDGVEITLNQSIASGSITLRGKVFDLSEIMSVWYRRPGKLQNDISNILQKNYAEGELSEFIRQLYASLDHVFWVSSIYALEKARRKLPQLYVAQKLGMLVPRTIVSNTPNDIRDFFTVCCGKMIYKTLHSPVIQLTEEKIYWGVPTTVITPEHLGKIELIRRTGGIFQEYIEKWYEIRVTIIGSVVFAAKIDSQSERTATIDWREAVALGKVSVTEYFLPKEIEDKCLKIIQFYQLNFGAIDLIRSKNGDYIFLELNCNGQWLWVEDLTGQRLIQSMADLLQSGSRVLR